MNIRDEELLYRYFEQQMSNSEEQNFLIDVAARDDMRMAFRSQLELLKAVRRDKDALPGAVAVRERTLGALGFAGVVLPSALAEDEAAAAPITISIGWRALLHKPLALVSGGLIVGSLATFSVMNMTTMAPEKAVAPAVASPQTPNEIRIEMPEQTTSDMPSILQPEAAPAKVAQRPARTNTALDAKPAVTSESLPWVNKSEPAQFIFKKPTIKNSP